MHGLVHKSDFNYSYSRSSFSRLPQAVSNKLICRFSQKFSRASKITDPVIIGFSPNDESIHLNICDHSIIIFGIGENNLRCSNTSHVDSLYRFRRIFFDKVKRYICI